MTLVEGHLAAGEGALKGRNECCKVGRSSRSRIGVGVQDEGEDNVLPDDWIVDSIRVQPAAAQVLDILSTILLEAHTSTY